MESSSQAREIDSTQASGSSHRPAASSLLQVRTRFSQDVNDRGERGKGGVELASADLPCSDARSQVQER